MRYGNFYEMEREGRAAYQLDSAEPELALDQTESFCQWLDAQGDSLPLPTSFSQWLAQTEDSI